MLSKLAAGTFAFKCEQDQVDYFIKCGFSKDLCEKGLGLTWGFTSEIVDGGWVVKTFVDNHPEYDSIDTFREGVENTVNSPYFGGKAKVTFTTVGENKYQVKADTDAMGKMQWTEEYSPAGATFIYTNPKAGDFKCFMDRQFKEEGWFQYVGGENFKEFMKAQGIGEDVWEGNQEAQLHFAVNGANRTLTEVWNGVTNVVHYKLDEECKYSWPGMPKMDRTYVTTKSGPGKYTSVMKGRNGEKETWVLQFTDKGCEYNGKDHVSGLTCKFWYESFTNIFGQFRPVAYSGVECYMSALGMPADMVAKLANDYSGNLTITKKDNGYIHTKFESKIMPVEITFRFNEEFTYSMPGIPMSFKSIETISGDTVTYVGKCDKCTVRSTIKFTDNFCIQTVNIAGTNIEAKMIMERV